MQGFDETTRIHSEEQQEDVDRNVIKNTEGGRGEGKKRVGKAKSKRGGKEPKKGWKRQLNKETGRNYWADIRYFSQTACPAAAAG